MVSRSSIEAGFRSLAAIMAELSWLQSLLSELHITCSSPPTIYGNNLSTVLLATNPILHSRTKHFDLDLYFVRDKVAQKQAFVVNIPSFEQVVDILTKSLSFNHFNLFKSKLRLSSKLALSFVFLFFGGDEERKV